MKLTAAIALLAVLALAGPLAAQTRSTRVSFADGANQALFKGAVSGSDTLDYVVGVRAGQKVAVSLTTAAAYFNLSPPGAEPALFTGSQEAERTFVGRAPVSGDYVVRVYLARAEDKRGKAVPFTLGIGVSD